MKTFHSLLRASLFLAFVVSFVTGQPQVVVANENDVPDNAQLFKMIKSLQNKVSALETSNGRYKKELAEAHREIAVTRGAPAQAIQASVNTARASATESSVAARTGSFQGPYIGLLGGHDFYTGQNDAPSPSYYYLYPQSAAPVEGGLLGLFGGYNAMLGTIVVGTEVRLNRGFSKFETDQPSSLNFNNSLPVFLESCGGSCSPQLNPPTTQSDPTVLARSSYASTKIMKTFSGDVSTRMGIVAFDEWLLYGRLAAGAQLFDASRTTSTTDTLCGSPIVTRTITPGFPYSSYTDYLTSCGRTSTTTTTFTQSETSVTPYLSVGFGIEKNVGQFFGRGEIELIDYLGSFNGTLMQYSPFYQFRLTAGAGYRFQ